VFGYAVELAARDVVLATAETGMMVLDVGLGLSRLPPDLLARLPESPDPVRLF
jgi:hypothetical protein